MLSAFFAVISFLLLVGGVAGVYESRLYATEDRAQAPLLAKLYPVLMGLVGLVGAVSLLWLLSGKRLNVALFNTVVIASTLPCFVQYRMHRKMGVGSSPLLSHVNERYGGHS